MSRKRFDVDTQLDVDTDELLRKVDHNAENLLKKLEVKIVNGKPRILGFEIPADFSPFVPLVNLAYQWGIAPLTAYVSDIVYKQSSKLATKNFYGGDPIKGHKFGTWAEIVVAAAMLGIDPITKVIGAAKDYAFARSKLYNDFRQIRESTGATAYNNEIMRVEYQHARKEMWDVWKSIGPEVPGLIVQGLYVGYDKMDKAKEREKELKAAIPLTDEQRLQRATEKLAEAARHETEAKAAGVEALNRKEFIDNGVKAAEKTFLSGLKDKGIRDEVAKAAFKEQEEEIKRTLAQNWEKTKAPVTQTTEQKVDDGWGKYLLFTHREKTIAASAATTQALTLFNEQQIRKRKQSEDPRACERIKNLKEKIDKIKAKQKDTSICGINIIDPRHLQDPIRDIFLQHEIDIGRGELTGASNLRALDEASLLIAEAIASGRLDTTALGALVGERMIVVPQEHASDVNSRTVVSHQIVEQKIAELQPKLGACTIPTAEEFYKHFDSAKGTKEQLKNYLGGMPDGIEKDCFASIFSYDVLKEAGWDREKAVAAHTRAKKHMHDVVERSIKEIASKSDDELIKYNLTDNDIRALNEIEHVFKKGTNKQRETLIKSLIDGQAHSILQNILGVAVLQELETDKGAWTKRIEAGRSGHAHSHSESPYAPDSKFKEENSLAERFPQKDGYSSEHHPRGHKGHAKHSGSEARGMQPN